MTSLIAYSPGNAGGYMQWGIPFQWHSVATGTGGLTIGPYRYVLPFDLGLDLIFWCFLAGLAVYGLLSALATRRKAVNLNAMNGSAQSERMNEA